MSEHTIDAELENRFHVPGMPDDEREVAHPRVAITYNYAPGRPAYTPRGEYAPIDPPEPEEVDFVSAKLIDGDGLCPMGDQLNDWAKDWLYDDAGYRLACNHADRGRHPDPDYEYESRRDDARTFADD